MILLATVLYSLLCAAAQDLARDFEKAAFLARHNGSYGYGMPNFENFVQSELGGRLQGDVYLDYAASGLYTDTQINEQAADLKQHLYGNPHSLSSSAIRSSDAIEAVRAQVLAFLGTSPADYEVVFTRSCTDSLRLVADTLPWEAGGSKFTYLLQNHNSVLGIRDVARSRSAAAGPITPEEVDDWLEGLAANDTPSSSTVEPLSLFAYPAEENFAGRMFPLQWAAKVASRKGELRRWRVLLDAAKFSASHPLNLTEAPADFVTLSFYKLFGYPTGVGALILKSDVASELKKCYWGGGTVTVAGAGRTAEDDLRLFKARACERFEDGTVAFLGIAALKHGFSALHRVGGMAAIERHTAVLAAHLHEALCSLRHANGELVVLMYSGEHVAPNSRVESAQGPIVNFNVMRPDGSIVSHIDVMASAAEAGLHIRAGAHCNPGAASSALGLSPEAVARVAEDPAMQGCGLGPAFVKASDGAASSHEQPLPDFLRKMEGLKQPEMDLPLGSVRVSIGYLSTYDDVRAFVAFVQRQYQA